MSFMPDFDSTSALGVFMAPNAPNLMFKKLKSPTSEYKLFFV